MTKRLGRPAATALAFGSVAGSGILSLPSAVYAETGTASLLVWVVAALMCLPMLVMFRDAMALPGRGGALEALVSRGLPLWVGPAIPLMFLFVVVVGLPTGAVVAGRYVVSGWGMGGGEVAIAAAILAVALLTTLAGGHLGTAIQTVGGLALVATGTVLITLGLGDATRPLAVVPGPDAVHTLLPGVLLAFWAFVGFENMTFLRDDLREPARDFLPVTSVALLLYGGFAVALTLAISARRAPGDVDPLAGLLVLADSPALTSVVVVVALAAMLINASAWVRGVSGLVRGASREGYLPRVLADSPALCVLLLAALFAVTLTVLALDPRLAVGALAASSAVFVMIYLLCIVGYVRTAGWGPWPVANLVLIPVMLVTLVQSGLRSVYGIVVVLACLGWSFARSKRTSHTPPDS